MTNIPEYGCTRCNKSTPRRDLVVKKALFTTMGEGAESLRSRVIDWLCPSCLNMDIDWNRKKFSPPRMAARLVQSG